MSLVERTLKKMQESQAAQRGEAAKVAPAAGAVPPRAPQVSPDRPPMPIETTRVISIDRARLREMDLLPPPEMERRIASQYRQIKRPLVASVLGGNLGPASHVIMLASALPGEGKTFTSINLALSLALEKDIEVLLVDADVPKPHVSRIFGMQQEPGLMDLLHHPEMHPNQVILRTDVPGLTLLPAGRGHDTATEMLASERMAQVIQQLAVPSGRRIVLLDSPPLMLSTESRVLAAAAGQVVLVVRAESTSRQAVSHALDVIGEGKTVSLILNQSSAAPTESYYGSYGDSQEPPRSS
jgi:receptor protein-tyrosine kinase